ncbi:MAG: S-adenosyl-l-methionine hydroxide adenosyltransferase family protein [Salinibacter sp.]|uniref:S-adenosyl-l-methionine hydroxide adenosyltransferase family protein n=1 Tax=Salinibacter sp. TaxID=2065818 RepID=UPI0035D4B9D1
MTSSQSDAPLITITTDFGTEDAYVPAMKGTMLSICPDARLVDVTHEIRPQDVMEAGFVLQSALPYFPKGSIHLVVVDPGVGTDRRAIALRAGDQWFVGPDNGVFPLVLNDEPPDAAVDLDNPDFWRSASPSTTFHGRDIFAPAAAHLAHGQALADIGSPIESLEPLRWAQPSAARGTVRGRVIHVDHFGNCVTNVRRSTLAEATPPEESDSPSASLPSLSAHVGNTVLDEVHATYGDVPEGDPLLLFGSTGYLEIGVNGGNAAELLDIRKGDSVELVLEDPSE